MFVLYLPAEDSRDCEILTRPEQISVSGSWHRERGRLSLRPSASNPIFLVMDAGSPKAAFTTRSELQTYLRRRFDTFINPLVYTFWSNQGPSIMTMSAALAE